jgi:hypothetical protein
MTLAMLKVLPEPVTPSSVWCQPGFDALDHQADGFRLIAGGLETGDELKFGHVPLGSRCRNSRLHSQTGRNEKGRKRRTSPEEKLDCAQCGADCTRFQGNVLHPSKSLTMPID